MRRFIPRLTPRWFPFAEIATPDLPLGRLFRLSLFQVSVGITLVMLAGTLNRVMIVELNVSASLVSLMLAVPLLFAPLRALIGFRSDNHQSALGWRRVPYIWNGSLAQFGGFSIMPFALLVLAGQGESGVLPAWVGQLAAGLSFLLVGAGAHVVQTAGLALATDLTPERSHPKVVGLMYVMLLLGMMGSALVLGYFLQEFSPGRLVKVIQSVALLVVVLNFISVWKQEPRSRDRGAIQVQTEATFSESWAHFCEGADTLRRLLLVGLGTMAFGMADVLLEPFGGHVLNLSVSTTTLLTALFAAGGLVGFAAAVKAVSSGTDANAIASWGAVLGLPAFILVMAAAPLQMPAVFVVGNFLIGVGGALFAHGTLTATMSRAPKDQVGLALGAWGAVQATAAGAGLALSGIIRDVVDGLVTQLMPALASNAAGYMAVYAIEMALLVVTVIVAVPMIRRHSLLDGRGSGASGDASTAL